MGGIEITKEKYEMILVARVPTAVGITRTARSGVPTSKPCKFDHKDGGGSEERKTGKIGGNQLYYEIKKHPERFQLLCARPVPLMVYPCVIQLSF